MKQARKIKQDMESSSFHSFLEKLCFEKQVNTVHKEHFYFKNIRMWWWCMFPENKKRTYHLPYKK